MLKVGRSQILTLLAALLFIAAIVWFEFTHLFPMPPSTLPIAGSISGDHYERVANRYKQILARQGIVLDVQSTSGAVDNLNLLRDANSGIQVGFVQGGISNGQQAAGLLSLGQISYQPFWLFHQSSEPLDDMSQLKGKRIALGPIGSGGRAVTEKLLALGGVTSETATLLPIAGYNAYDALAEGTIDVLFLAFTPDEPVLQLMLRDTRIQPLNFTKAEAIVRIFPFLSRLTLPRGIFDYEKSIPASDVNIVAATNVVLVRKDIHPTLIELLVQTMQETHGEAGRLFRANEFPIPTDPEYPMAERAREFYRSGPSSLNKYLPFWMTHYVQRGIALTVTVVAIIVPLFRHAPRFFRSLVGYRLSSMNRRLRTVEDRLQGDLTVADLSALDIELGHIDRAIHLTKVPIQHSDLFFLMKSNLVIVRADLESHRAKLNEDQSANMGSRNSSSAKNADS